MEVKDGQLLTIFKALSSKTRLAIVRMLLDGEKDVSRVAQALGQTEANISAQVKILEKAGLIKSRFEPGYHGIRKVCAPACEKLVVSLR